MAMDATVQIRIDKELKGQVEELYACGVTENIVDNGMIRILVKIFLVVSHANHFICSHFKSSFRYVIDIDKFLRFTFVISNSLNLLLDFSFILITSTSLFLTRGRKIFPRGPLFLCY